MPSDRLRDHAETMSAALYSLRRLTLAIDDKLLGREHRTPVNKLGKRANSITGRLQQLAKASSGGRNIEDITLELNLTAFTEAYEEVVRDLSDAWVTRASAASRHAVRISQTGELRQTLKRSRTQTERESESRAAIDTQLRALDRTTKTIDDLGPDAFDHLEFTNLAKLAIASGAFDHTLVKFANDMTQGLSQLGFEVPRPDWLIGAEPTFSENGRDLA